LITNKSKLYPSVRSEVLIIKKMDWMPRECVMQRNEKRVRETILTLDKNNETDCRIVTSLFNTWSACSSINAH
jgi:hypothetical protein